MKFAVEQLAEPLRVGGAGGRLGVVLGEVERVGQEKRVEPRGGARRRVARDRCATSARLRLGHPELVEQSRPTRARRAPRVRPAPRWFRRRGRMRASSASVKKNGRRNGQRSRPPKVRCASRIRPASDGRAFGRRAPSTQRACQCCDRRPSVLTRRPTSGGRGRGRPFLPIAATTAAGLPCSARSITSVGHPLDDEIEVVRRDAVALEVGRRIEEVDRVGHAVLDGELDGVHLVAERVC